MEVSEVQLLAGIHSFGIRFKIVVGGYFDLSDDLNSSFGEFAGDTRVAAFDQWIDSVIVPQSGGEVPEPTTLLLIGPGLLGLLGLRKKFKK